jgi:hypothetical protein
MRFVSISRCNLQRLYNQLATLQAQDLRYRGYWRTLGDVLADWRNTGDSLRIRQELLIDLGRFADRHGAYSDVLPHLEHARKIVVEYWSWAEHGTKVFDEYGNPAS